MRHKTHVELALHFEGANESEPTYVSRSLKYAMAISLGRVYHPASGLPLLAHKIACDSKHLDMQLERIDAKRTY